jgi:hypothetical protein
MIGMLEIVIDNRDGFLWNISGIVSDITYKTTRIGRASTLELTMIKGGLHEYSGFKYSVGDVIRIRQDELNVFYGYIFVIGSGRDEEVKITAYDQLRYLMASDSYVFKEPKTATEIIRKIADDFKLKVGRLDDTGYKIPKLLEDTQKLLDIICKTLTLTLNQTGKIFVFYDNFGELALRDTKDLVLDFAIGDVSLMFDYKLNRSIDSSANVIKLIKDNKDTGRREVFVTPENSNMSKWGILQHYESVDEKMNDAQIKEQLKKLYDLKNREQITFTVDAIGDFRVRAGVYLFIVLEELGIKQYFLVNECTHKVEGNDHTMTLDLSGVIGSELVGNN